MNTLVVEVAQRREAKRSGDDYMARCPAHDDRNASLSIGEGRDGRVLLKCFAGCSFDQIVSAAGLTTRDLFPEPAHRQTSNGPIKSAAVFDWQKCVAAITDKHFEQLAKRRGFSPEFVRELRDNGQIGIYDGLVAFPVYDESGAVVGAHVRAKNDKWFYFPEGSRTTPLVFGKLVAGDPVHVFESTWDGLDYMDKSGERDGVIIARGSGNARPAAALIPPGSTCYVWTQNDKSGADFEKALVSATTYSVKRVTIPVPLKDLNDWTRAGATSEDLLDAMNAAETLREAEKSWDDALSESIVTSLELSNLALTPRKKLLGDWLCEGDCGFVYAPRGVGKTWFALAIAQALSTAGKLGEWKALERVRVLYVDGEMPPDLMRDRANGLERGNDNLEFLNHLILFERAGRVLNIANREVQQALTAHCIKNAVKVLILDNLSTLASGMKENEADSWEQLNPWLLDLRRRRIAVVIVHHAGRSGQMRGTSKREDNVFWIIALDDMKKNADDKRGARFISHFTKPSRNTQHEVPAFEWHFVTELNGQVSIAHKQAQTLDVFRSVIESGVTKCDEVADAMKLPKYEVSRMAKKAEKEGWLIRPRRGEYDIKKEVQK